MIDKDGKFEYSNTVSVNNTTTTSTAVAVYPNPATSYSFVKHPVVTGNETIGVYNNNGMMLAQVKASGNQTRLDVSSFAKGTYHVVFSSSTDRQVCKLVVN
ncbi:MAG: T9SS type A sorting domain-containing protein [Flavitalea sp.]